MAWPTRVGAGLAAAGAAAAIAVTGPRRHHLRQYGSNTGNRNTIATMQLRTDEEVY